MAGDNTFLQMQADFQKGCITYIKYNTNNWRRMHGLPMQRRLRQNKNKRNIFVPDLGRDELWELCSFNLDVFQKMMERTRKYGGD